MARGFCPSREYRYRRPGHPGLFEPRESKLCFEWWATRRGKHSVIHIGNGFLAFASVSPPPRGFAIPRKRHAHERKIILVNSGMSMRARAACRVYATTVVLGSFLLSCFLANVG